MTGGTVQGTVQSVNITGVSTVLISSGNITATLTGNPQVSAGQYDGSGNLLVNCVAGCGGGASGNVYVTNPTTTTVSNQVQVYLVNQATVTVQGTVPVSGTFFQATQPVSIASMPSTPVTGTFFQPVQPVAQSGVFSCAIPGSSNTVNVSNFPASQAVTGTFFQATQPVSVATPYAVFVSTVQVVASTMGVTNVSGQSLNVNVAAGSIANTGFNVNNTPNVTFPSAQPVTSTYTVVTTTYPVQVQVVQSTPGVVNAAGTQLTVVSTGLPVSVSNNVPTTTADALLKGVQASTGTTVQELKDAGRAYLVLVATGVAGVTSETLFTFSQNRQGVNTDNVTSYTVTSGKTLRIEGLHCSNRDGTTTTAWTRAVLRHNTAGATTINSPKVFSQECGGAGALAGSTGNFNAPFPEGVEIYGNGTQSIGVSHIDQATTNVVTCTLVGYEY